MALIVTAAARPGVGAGLRQTAGLWRGPPYYAWIAVFPTHSAAWYMRPIARQPAMLHAKIGRGSGHELAPGIVDCRVPDCRSRVAPAVAQFPPASQQAPPCVAEFGKLRDEAAKKAGAIRAASARKAPPDEACKLFNAFSSAEEKMLKYAEDNSVWCGIPPQVIQQIKQSHAKTTEFRTQICQAAAAPPRPVGPTLERHARRSHYRLQQHQDRPRHLRHPDR